jgi:hypothetical protein
MRAHRATAAWGTLAPGWELLLPRSSAVVLRRFSLHYPPTRTVGAETFAGSRGALSEMCRQVSAATRGHASVERLSPEPLALCVARVQVASVVPGRLLVRVLRVFVTCLALSLVMAPAMAPARSEAIAWLVGAHGTAAAEAPGSDGTRVDRPSAPSPEPAPLSLTHEDDRATRRPSGARALIVLARVYLRNASLLC